MKRIDIQEILQTKAPGLFTKYPKIFVNIAIKFLNKLLCVNEVNTFLEKHNDKRGFDFIDALFNHLNFSYKMSAKHKENIPSEGKLVIVSNHPLGGLDGLALLKAVSEVRKDVKIVANDILSNLENLSQLFLPFDLYSSKSQKENILNIDQALLKEQAVIFFPSGEVSRMSITGIKDGKWKKGAMRFATRNNAPILPAFVEGKNSFIFYALSLIYRRIGTFLLPRELFGKKNENITIIFGDPIPSANIDNSINSKIQADLLRRHIYRVGNEKKGIFATEKTIIHPVPTKLVKEELQKSELLGATSDGKKIFLCKYETAPNVIKEISRLREITFRKVGEGTGNAYDADIYDLHYHHIVLWDSDELDIVGAYRLGITKEIIEDKGIEGLYNSSQFYIHKSFDEVLDKSIELGRSFIQQKYWRTNALDYIWQGIGAFIQKYSYIRYLWGAVSISNSFSEPAKAMIVFYYKKWFNGNPDYVTPIKPFLISDGLQEELEAMFNGENFEEDFRILKGNLEALGFTIPVLYRRYTDICNFGGSLFLTFSIDESFMNAVDGLILVDLHALKDEYKERYYSKKSLKMSS